MHLALKTLYHLFFLILILKIIKVTSLEIYARQDGDDDEDGGGSTNEASNVLQGVTNILAGAFSGNLQKIIKGSFQTVGNENVKENVLDSLLKGFFPPQKPQTTVPPKLTGNIIQNNNLTQEQIQQLQVILANSQQKQQQAQGIQPQGQQQQQQLSQIPQIKTQQNNNYPIFPPRHPSTPINVENSSDNNKKDSEGEEEDSDED